MEKFEQKEEYVSRRYSVFNNIFNIVIDSIIRDCEGKKKENGVLPIQSYADDGIIGGKDHKVVQETLPLFEELSKIWIANERRENGIYDISRK